VYFKRRIIGLIRIYSNVFDRRRKEGEQHSYRSLNSCWVSSSFHLKLSSVCQSAAISSHVHVFSHDLTRQIPLLCWKLLQRGKLLIPCFIVGTRHRFCKAKEPACVSRVWSHACKSIVFIDQDRHILKRVVFDKQCDFVLHFEHGTMLLLLSNEIPQFSVQDAKITLNILETKAKILLSIFLSLLQILTWKHSLTPCHK